MTWNWSGIGFIASERKRKKNEKQSWTTLYASGSRFGEALKAERQRLQQLRSAAMAAARTGNASDSVLGADINSFGHGISKLYKLTFDYTGSLERAAITRRANELPRDNPRRMAFLASADCRYSNQLLQGTPIEARRFTVREFRSAVQNKFGVPQGHCLPIAGRPTTNHAKNTPLRVGGYGHFLKTVTGAKYDGIRQLNDSIVNLLSRWLKRAHVPHKGGAWVNP